MTQFGIIPIDNKFVVGDSVSINGYTYNSLKKQNVKCIDYFLEMNNDSIGCVEFYIQFNNCIYLLLKQYKTTESKYHLDIVQSSDELRVYQTNEIKELKMYLTYGTKEIVAVPPNFFEET